MSGGMLTMGTMTNIRPAPQSAQRDTFKPAARQVEAGDSQEADGALKRVAK
jgi:hypothetical protein